jgi:hypothetical protein
MAIVSRPRSATADAPSTMLRMVPLPRFAGADIGRRIKPAYDEPERDAKVEKAKPAKSKTGRPAG